MERRRILLSHRFYKAAVVEQALSDFKDSCTGRILNQRIEVELVPRQPIEHLEEEFCNYCLALMQDRG
jgi:hypothetical protein